VQTRALLMSENGFIRAGCSWMLARYQSRTGLVVRETIRG